MREIIYLQVGGCGNQIGVKEHCIDSAGIYYGLSDLHLERINVYYDEVSKGRYFPRAVLVDPKTNGTDAICNSPLSEFFPSNNTIYSKFGCGSDWGHAYCDQGAEIIDDVLNVIHKEIELCDYLQGFQLTHSLNGGTGSGFGTLLIDKLREEYLDRPIMTFSSLTSSEICEHVIEPYNIILSMNHLIENVDAAHCFDNEALYRICSRERRSSTYNDLNRLISTSMSGITTSFRFPDQINGDMRKFNVNMVPFPRLHFFISSFAPIFSHNVTSHNSLTSSSLTELEYDNKNIQVCCDPRQGRYLSMTTTFRGELSMKEIDEYAFSLQTKYSSSHLKNIKTVSCKIPLKEHEMSSVLTGNNTAIQDVLKYFLEKFSTMFCRKLYVSGYLRSGMDEMEFTEAECNVKELINEYQDIQSGKTEELAEERD